MGKFNTLFIIVGILLCLFGLYNYSKAEEIDNVVVENFLTQQNIGETATDYQYLVITDKGTFEIDLDGIFNATHCFGKIVVGDTINITTRGVGAEFWGIYRHIVDVR